MGVGLVGARRVQQPDPRRQGWWNIEHGLTTRDELLSQQRAEPGRLLDRPGARCKARCERQHAIALMIISSEAQLGNHRLAAIQHCSSVRGLMRIDPDCEHHDLLTSDGLSYAAVGQS